MRRAVAPVLPLVVLAVSSCRCDGGGKGNEVLLKPPEPLPPLSAPDWLVDLDVPGFEKAAVAAPLGAIEPRPIVIALHGDPDRAEWQCGTWVGIAKSHPFVLCPRGIVRKDPKDAPERYGWGSVQQSEKELRAALLALKARFGKHVAPGSVVMVAYGAGVKHGAWLVRQEPSFFARVVFVGAGAEDWSAGFAGLYAAGRGQRMLWVCSDDQCVKHSEPHFAVTRAAGVRTKLVDAGDLDGQLDARAATAIAPEFAWLVDDDPRYPPFKPPDAAGATSSPPFGDSAASRKNDL